MNNRQVFELPGEIVIKVATAINKNVPEGLIYKGEKQRGPNLHKEYNFSHLKNAQLDIIFCDNLPTPSEIEIVASERNGDLDNARIIVQTIFNITFSFGDTLIG
jgi:hypothetical protein